MRHQHLLIRRLATLLRSRMTTAGHLAQVIDREHRGNCLPPRNGCSAACQEAQALMALTEPFMPVERTEPTPIKPLRHIVLKRPTRRRQPAVHRVRTIQPTQMALLDEVAG